jgi:ABC-type enterochelin transport system permease subunit
MVFVIILLLAVWFIFLSSWDTAIILLVFGATGAAQCWKDVRIYFLKKEMSSSALMRDHIGKMSGSYIAAITAFLVNNVDFLPPLVVWLSPTILGTMVIIRFSKPYRN